MKILNAMLGRGQGGIEQAFIDYHDALVLAGHEVRALIHPAAAVRTVLETRNIAFDTLPNWGAWDPMAIAKLGTLLKRLSPAISIAHGNRAVSLLKRAGAAKLVAPLHNYKIKCCGVTAALSPTRNLYHYAENQGLPAKRIFDVPNLVRVPVTAEPRKRHNPTVIGSMGRFVSKKGFDVFIDALAILKQRDVNFKACLAGGGEDAEALRMRMAARKLDNVLTFSGWVEDKAAFFDSIDIFCLPSHHEPFGIVLLEAMAHKLPVITTNSEGPSEIIDHRINGLIVPRGDAAELATGLEILINDPGRAQQLAKHAYDTVRGSYDLPVISAKLDLALRSVSSL